MPDRRFCVRKYHDKLLPMAVSVSHCASLLFGVASFLLYFVRGEHHLYVKFYIKILIATVALTSLGHAGLNEINILSAVLEVSGEAGYFLLGLYGARSLYRLLFHPLQKFAGPVGARITSFWLSWRVRHLDTFRQLKILHDQYGPFVRIGPDNLSISNPKAVQAIYGSGSKCTKSSWYDSTWPMVSLNTMREKKLHDERRRTWSPAFGEKALRGYEQRLRLYRNRLISHLIESNGAGINVTQWFNLFSFDFMGDLAFGRSFDMLELNQEHWVIKLLDEALQPLGYALPAWLFQILTSIPGVTKDWWRFVDFCAERMDARLKTKVDVPDIMSALSAPYKGGLPTNEDWRVLRGDAQLIVVAGSDTTATTLSAALFQLAQHPKYIKRLRTELAPYMTELVGDILNERIAKLDCLNAVIYETLRLHPPVPSLQPRKTPPEGIVIDGMFIPGDTVVSCPQYVIGRSAAAYEQPEYLIPERWYSSPSMVKVKSAWAPFSVGPYGCIGRPLALLTVRTTLARIVTTFDISFAPGEDGGDFESKAHERFTIGFGDLKISFKLRELVESLPGGTSST
ncbi:putative cytochrome P450 [Paraphaeosphaeria sporulosa]|uniref:Putative cytochrome P450 n=1 Tax=Paraphaeosphaeria sporulosa TaxID=1460663 RepID=A0A177CAM2_9PLEO|nr:putative cytochrome P450 [Paraphaeosphaeria sporulosa]OAG03770.1 putative cytochrome P450 [Paraphaeosphaeria sporulosa]